MSADVLYLKIDIEKPSFSILNSLTLKCFAQIFNFRDKIHMLKLVQMNQDWSHSTRIDPNNDLKP